MTIRVWYKLDDASSSKVQVDDGADVDDLRHAIKGNHLNYLANVDAASLVVFAAGGTSELQPFDPVPTDTTGKRPIIIKVPDDEKKKALYAAGDGREVDMNNVDDLVEGGIYDIYMPPAKKAKGQYKFTGEFKGFLEYVNGSINNKKDTFIFEREQVEERIIDWMKLEASSPKPNIATIWSGRGSGKTSLIRKIVMKSDYLQAARDSGRLMVFDASHKFVGDIVSELAEGDTTKTIKFIVVLVAFHLCKIFGDASVDGVSFHAEATFVGLWKQSNDLPSTLVDKMKTINTGEMAYEWWKSCTQGFLKFVPNPLEGNHDPKPVIFVDTAETLAVVHKRSPPRKTNSPHGENAVPVDTESKTAPMSPDATNNAEANTPTPHKHQNSERYLVLERIMMHIPIYHSLIVFGTGQRRELPVPSTLQTHVNHRLEFPLHALSEAAAMKLFDQMDKMTFPTDAERLRYVKTAYAVTAGIPRMLVLAFGPKRSALLSRHNELWEEMASQLYNDVYQLMSNNMAVQDKLSVSCLAKAIIISAVCDVEFEHNKRIVGEKVSWDDLRWRSIAFLTGGEGSFFRIPRLLWHQQAVKIKNWIENTCHFDVHDLLPTINHLYAAAGDAASTSSGIAWEKMFASAVVARFFALCWIDEVEPEATYIGLERLLPQADGKEDDMKTLSKVEVCLAKGIIVSKNEAYATNELEEGFESKAIHANWAHISAHHDLILPVRYKQDKKLTNYAVSARCGRHKTEAELTETEQHFVRKGGQAKVNGIIQALAPRHTQTGRTLSNEFKTLSRAEKYAEVIITTGHVHYVLGCFA